MSKGYWIGHVDVNNVDSYAEYLKLASATIKAFGGNPIVRGGPAWQVEGALRRRHVVVEFPSVEIARACYESDEYQKAKAMRNKYADSDLVIVEGGP